MTNPIADVDQAQLLFLIGTNTTEAHPVLGYRMQQARRRGTRLIVVDPRRTELADLADYFVQLRPGTDIALLNGLMHIILAEGLEDRDFIAERCENFEELRDTVARYTPAHVAEITGVPEETLYAVARLYATTDRAALYYTLGITEHVTGTMNVMSCANLAMLTGHLGRPGTGVNPIRGQNNVQGACDMGALPNVYPGYQNVSKPEVREKFERAWGRELSGEVGRKIPEMFDAAHRGDLKAMFILGENPVLSDPNTNHIRAGLEKLEFLVVQELFLTETAQYADVILPGASFAEEDGTFTNTERRVQRARTAVEPLAGMADWQIVAELMTRMGLPSHYADTSEIFDEMAALTPSYAGMSHARLERDGLHWPCPTPDHPGTPILHVGKFSRGLGRFQAIEHVPPGELPDAEYPFLLSTGRLRQHYNVTTAYSPGIMELWGEERAWVNPEDARRLGLTDESRIRVASRRGVLETAIQITDRVPPGMVWMSFHHAGSPANALTSHLVDPVSGTGEYKVCAIKVEQLAS